MLPSFLAVVLSALWQVPQGHPAFSSTSELVVLHVSVVNRKGFVPGLPRGAFTVYEDGHPQPIAFFANEDTPVTVGLVIDSSGSMQPRRDTVIAAGMAFAESSHPADEMFTINFNEKVWDGLPADRPFTSDHEDLRRALLRSTARGQTALFDAIAAGLRRLEEGAKPRKVLVVISDGGDNASRTAFDDILAQALERDVVIYTIGIYDRNDHDAKPKLLRQLADVTGGEAFFPRENDEVGPILQRIARDIRSSYTIGYVPADGRGKGPHRIRVDAHDANRDHLKVRSRSMYVAPGEAGGHE